jgi:DNA adenine methylase
MRKTSIQEPVKPVVPVAPWVGGKRALSHQLTALIASVAHETYAEPFVGMGGVFLRRAMRPRAEVINDLSDDVVTLFRVMKEHREALQTVLEGGFASRAEWQRLMAMPPETLTDIQRAARFIYIQRLAYGGKVVGRNFGVTVQGSRYNPDKVMPVVDAIGRRLAGVLIEKLSWDAFILRYDRPGTLFFIDPPYWGNEGDYGSGIFMRADFERMAAVLAALKGRFIMTINDRPEVHALFGGFDLQPVRLSYRVAGAPTAAYELIVASKGILNAAN